jgi:regulator of sirC expression with transglutaminase-like and TPR domain
MDPELALFSHVATRPDPELDLAQAALLIARTEYPELDVSRYIRVLDELAREAREVIQRGGSVAPHERLVRWAFEEVGFQGNATDYYDPRNSYLNDVIERRKGIPISLAVILIELGRRIEIPLEGVSFPGHFLLKTVAPDRPPEFINPFDGQRMSRAELRALHARAVGEERDPDPRLLERATKQQILVRMLNNLRGIYSTRGDRVRLRAVLERMSVLVRSQELRRQLEQLGGSSPWPSGSSGHALN